MRPFRPATALPLVAGILLGGCATRGLVRAQAADLEKRQDARSETIDKSAREALIRADTAGKLAEGKFVYSVVVRDDGVKFPTDKAELSPEAQTALATLARRLLAEGKNVFLEIQGFTDDVGDADYNFRLGQSRAEAAYRFLHRQGLAAHRMATISYGENNPVVPNDSEDGRATNRRIAIIVLD